MKTFAIAGLAILAASTAAFAQSGGQLAVAQGTNTQTYDVPAGSKPQTVIITTRDLKDGESFVIPREVPHDCRPQPGSVPVHLSVTLVIDTGTPPRSPVTDVLIPKK